MDQHRKHSYALLGIICLGFIIRALYLNDQALWYDEMAQASVAAADWKDLLPLVTLHTSPPLDYILMKLVMLLFGKADWVIRMPAFLFGVASIYVFYLLARALTDRENGLLATALLALSPMAVFYSQEARMYALFLFLSLTSYLLTLFLIKRNDLKTSVWLGIVNGLLLLSHYFGIFVIAGEEIILLSVLLSNTGRKRRAAFTAVALLISAVMFLPWLPYFVTQLDYTGAEAGYALRANRYFFSSILSSFAIMTGQYKVWVYAYLILFVLGAAWAWRNRDKKVITVALSVAGTLGLLFGLSYYARVVTPRNVLFLLPLFLLVCAHGFYAIIKRCRIAYIPGTLIVVLLAVWPAVQAARSGGKINWRDAAVYLKQQGGADEKVITTDFISRACLAYYLDPEADYVIMKKRWRETANEPGWKVWVINDELIAAIEEQRFSGWVVIPPSAFLAVSEEQLDAYNARMGQPVKQFKLFKRALNIYKVPDSA
jgi:uncharacterized membrane protein